MKFSNCINYNQVSLLSIKAFSKAVYDEDGNPLDTSRLGQMKETAHKSEQLAGVSSLRAKDDDDFYESKEDGAKEIPRKRDYAAEKKSKNAKESLKKLQVDFHTYYAAIYSDRSILFFHSLVTWRTLLIANILEISLLN